MLSWHRHTFWQCGVEAQSLISGITHATAHRIQTMFKWPYVWHCITELVVYRTSTLYLQDEIYKTITSILKWLQDLNRPNPYNMHTRTHDSEMKYLSIFTNSLVTLITTADSCWPLQLIDTVDGITVVVLWSLQKNTCTLDITIRSCTRHAHFHKSEELSIHWNSCSHRQQHSSVT